MEATYPDNDRFGEGTVLDEAFRAVERMRFPADVRFTVGAADDSSQAIRGLVPKDGNYTMQGGAALCCPITAWVKLETGSLYGVYDFSLAAEKVGVGSLAARLIIRAADNASNHCSKLRAALLAKCGLSES